MAEYRYSLDGRSGEFWHVSWKIQKLYQIAIPSGPLPVLVGLSITATEIIVKFAEALTPEQEGWLSTLITDPDLFAPHMTGFQTIATNVFLIQDKFEEMSVFNSWIDSMGISGLKAMLFADTDGNMEVHFNKLLTNPEKNKVEAAYSALGNWKA